MPRLIRFRPQHGTVVAYTALFVALGGTGYAATQGAPNSADVARRNASPHADARQDLALIRRQSALLRGPAGPKGDPGPAGPKGDAGTQGATNVTVVRKDLTVPPGGSNGDYANCPAGQRATGGGVAAFPSNEGDYVLASGPVNTVRGSFADTTTGTTPVSWFGRYHNGGAAAETAYLWAICAAP